MPVPLRVAEVASRLGLSISCIYQLLNAGKLKGTRHGLGRGTWRVSDEQLAEYLAKVEPAPKVPPARATAAGSFKHLNAEKLREAWEK